MPDVYITRLREALDLRLEQGYTKDEIAAAGGLTTDAIDAVLNRDTLSGVVPSRLYDLMEALFIDDGYVFHGTPTVQYSTCSMARLLDAHYHTVIIP